MNPILPLALSAIVERELAPFSTTAVRDAADQLSLDYRARGNIRHTLSPIERAAYLGVRFPSTLAVADTVWREISRILPACEIRSVLDAGAGPGTASLASAAHVRGAKYTLLERDAGWRGLALSLAQARGLEAAFSPGSIEHTAPFPEHDAVVASYALNEIASSQLSNIVDALWRGTGKILVVIEPGTPHGFEIVRAVREQALALGAHAAAPCTHDLACPMSREDWCHRPVRVQRSALHRSLKRAELSYEDEKFSYVVLTRDPPNRTGAGRIVRKPIRAKGHVHLDLCQDGGLHRLTLSRKQGATFKAARSAAWGEIWPPYSDGT